MFKGIVTLFAIFWVSITVAQEWELGLLGGTSGYMGDLNPENPLAFNDWAAGASVKYNLNHTWGVRGNFAYANTYAHDKNSNVQQRVDRNLAFFGAIKEAALLVDFNFFKWLPQRGRIVYTPYIFAGVAGIQFEPKWFDPSIKLREYKTEGVAYKNRTISIPFGAGFKYNLRGPWSVGVELGYRLALTDYLDDVSGNYIDHRVWNNVSNPGGYPAGSQRGDGRPYDSYMVAGFTVSYTIFKGGCPEWQ